MQPKTFELFMMQNIALVYSGDRKRTFTGYSSGWIRYWYRYRFSWCSRITPWFQGSAPSFTSERGSPHRYQFSGIRLYASLVQTPWSLWELKFSLKKWEAELDQLKRQPFMQCHSHNILQRYHMIRCDRCHQIIYVANIHPQYTRLFSQRFLQAFYKWVLQKTLPLGFCSAAGGKIEIFRSNASANNSCRCHFMCF